VEEEERKGKTRSGSFHDHEPTAPVDIPLAGTSWIRKGLESHYNVWMEMLLTKRRDLSFMQT